MSYFINFPTIGYNFELNGKITIVAIKDIALNVRVRKEILENITLFDEYDIEDNETFDIISEKLYGKPIYHWTIMLLNQRFDYRKDFPLTSIQLIKYCEQKYGEDKVYDQHIIFGNLHYEDRDGNTVQKLTEVQFAALYPDDSYIEYSREFESISNFEYEDRLNESKRRIKVLNPAMIDKVVSDIQRLLSGV